MKIAGATIERFSGALPQPIGNARRAWRERSGLLLTLVDDDGRAGQGEASPLPGYSPDDLESCRAALSALDWGELVAAGSASPLELLAAASNRVPAELPAARFAVETALLDLAAQRAGRPAWSLLRSSVRRLDSRPLPVPLCGLIGTADAGTDAVLGGAARLVARGLATLKLKIGQAGDLELARALRAQVGDCVLLRFDVNRAWPETDARERLASLAAVSPELVEEPAKALHTLGTSPVPLALDESLQQPGALQQLGPSLRELRVEAVVLKPAALGGLVRSVELAGRAQSLGLGVIVSHLFDGPVALASAAALALAVASPERASGLDRHAGLDAWPAVDIPIVGGTHVVPDGRQGLGIERLSGAER